jgi:hypothetical protein
VQLLVHAVYHVTAISTAMSRPSGVTLHSQTTNYNSFLLGTISSVASCTRSVLILLMTFNSHVTFFSDTTLPSQELALPRTVLNTRCSLVGVTGVVADCRAVALVGIWKRYILVR